MFFLDLLVKYDNTMNKYFKNIFNIPKDYFIVFVGLLNQENLLFFINLLTTIILETFIFNDLYIERPNILLEIILKN